MSLQVNRLSLSTGQRVSQPDAHPLQGGDAPVQHATAERLDGPFRFRSLARHGAIYGAGIALNKAVAFVMLPIYTRYLTPTDYGVLQLVTMTIEVVSILAGSRLIGGVFRFYHKAQRPIDRDRVIASSVALLGLLYLTAGALATLFATPLARYTLGDASHAPLVRLGALALALDGLAVVPMALLQLREMSGRFVLANSVKLLVGVGCNILFVVQFRLAAEGVLISTVIASAVIGVALFIWVRREVGLRPDGVVVRDLLRFGLPFVVMQVATFLSTFSDRYFINAAIGADAVGVYALAYQFAFLYLTVAFAPLMTAWQPERFRIATRDDRDAIYARAFSLATLLLLVAGVGIALFAEPTIRIMSAPSFHGAGRIVPLLILAYLFQAWTELVSTGLLIAERTDRIATANYVALVIALGGYAVVVPVYGTLGAASVTAAAFALRFALVLRASQRTWPIAYRWGVIVRSTAAATGIVAAVWFLPQFSLPADIAVRGIALLAAMVAIWFLAIPDAEERRVLWRGIRDPMQLLGRLGGDAT